MRKFLISLIVISLVSQVPGFSMDSLFVTEVRAEENTEPENKETMSSIVYEEETEDDQQENERPVVGNESEGVTAQSEVISQEQTVQGEEGVSVANVEATQEVYPFALGEEDLPFVNNTVTISTLAGFIKLSQCDPNTIKNVTIHIQVSGSISTIADSAYVEKEGTKYYFEGLGSTDCPFNGKFTGNTISITVKRALFNGVTSNVDCNNNTLIWSNSEQLPKSIIAESYVFNDTGEHTLNLKVSVADKSIMPGALFGEVRGMNGTLKLQNPISYGSYNTVNNQQSTQNAGFVCNTLTNGKIIIGSGFVFPESIAVSSDTGSAGGIIGKMEDGTSLEFNGEIASVTVNGGTHSGGLVGYAVNADITGTGKLTTVSVKAKKNAGGLIGNLEWSKDTELQMHGDMLANSTITLLSDSKDDSQPLVNAGGLYGTVKVGSGKRSTLTLTDALALNNDSSNLFGTFGGLIGNVVGGDTEVSILNINGNNKTISITNSNKSVSVFGGIIGRVGSHTTVFAQNNSVTIDIPKAKILGGLVGNIADTGIIVLEGDNKISTSTKIVTIGDETSAGGIVGSISEGSVLSISGTTDLSDVEYTEEKNYGQLVGKQNISLVFAKGSGNDDGWKYIRSSQKPKIDDIANYGQVIRLKSSADAASGKLSHDLFNVSNEGLLDIKEYGNTEFAVGSVNDFALLAVLWQTGGIIKANKTPEYNNISSATISLSNDIDLTGTGIIGLMKDTTVNNSEFSGSFDGGNHSVTLSIGEAYGCFKNGEVVMPATESDDGCGRIYYHDALGLFATINTNSSISNITINGKIDVETYADNCYVGGIAGLVQGGTFPINNVTVSEYVLCGNGTSKPLYAGGVFGALNNTATITFGSVDKPVVSNAVIKVSSTHSGKYMCMGGLIGAVLGANNQSVLTMTNVSLLESSDKSINLDGTYITDGQSFFAGGLIGAIIPYPSTSSNKKTINIEKVVVNGYKVATNNTSGDNSISGGLLGSLWINTDVIFCETNSPDDTYALQVVDGSNTADNVTYYGGLVYAASGKWTINSHGIDLSGAKLSATSASSFGILVHDAYDGVSYILGKNNINRGGLYIELTDHWDNAYILKNEASSITTSTKNSASFDEFAAYTAGSDVWLSEKNGVISLHTDDNNNDGKLLMNGTDINSYVNRSVVGITKKTNSHSRYYYNLDKMYSEVKASNTNNIWIDTNAELMLWSVCRYGATNLRDYFKIGDVTYNAYQIGGNSDATVGFDLNGYSYYPIDVLNIDLTIQNSDFVFYNERIENGENAKNNKNTSTSTQHEGMHCGLFRNYLRQSSSNTTTCSYELLAKNLSFSGTIGQLKNKSGALLCGKIEGNTTNGTNIYTVSASDILLKGLRVREMIEDSNTEYASLLIAEPSSYSTTSVSRISTDDYTGDKKAATSLIGKSGSPTATQINLSFSEMNLPSEKNSTIFTHASFLESFQYKEDGVGTAVYNFTKSDQDNNYVTFGAEIDNTKEYPGMQLWYYDENGYGTDANLVTVGDIKASKDENVSCYANKYLPYVFLPYPLGNDGKTQNCHEIEINHRIVDILTGCGTYADPYVITDEKELETIASFLQSGAPRKNWRVTISANQNVICSRRKDDSSLQDTIYICDGAEWKKQSGTGNDTLQNNTIWYYLLSAYYDIQDDLELKDFIGLGSKNLGFRGVVTSTNNNTITLKGSNTSHGLITYSYGSVVKDLTINYQKDGDNGITISSSTIDTFAPSAFFGGVIGVIMGGDNIIDNVSVTMDNSFLTLNGDKAHLIQVGGYVGSISGGGVIFRNMRDMSGMNDTWLNQTGTWTPSTSENENAYKSLYVNPFVGRVLDGFAFSEDCTINNTDKNYKINDIGPQDRNSDGTLKSSNDILGGQMLANGKGGSILTIKNAIGLLAFSAILNSGASAGPAFDYKGTSAYAGGTETFEGYKFGNARYGKVRCAAYDKIGNPNDASSDFYVALNDDQNAPGLQDNGGGASIPNKLNNNTYTVNLCYLAARFGDKYSMFAAVSNISDVRYVFTNATYDMTDYGNGYQGIGCRYKANAGRNLAADTANYDRVVPWIRYVQGNNATIKASINVREYADDDFWTMGVGALFGYSYFRNDTSLSDNDSNAVSDLTISDSTLSLKYYGSNGVEDKSGYSKRKAGVGGISGAQVGGYSIGPVNNVHINNTTIKGGYHAGGIFGSVGKVEFSASATGTHFVYSSDKKSSVSFINCGYQSLNVLGYFYSGGFVGELFSKKNAENLIQGVTGGLNEQAQGNIKSKINSGGDTLGANESRHQFSAGGLIGHYISDSIGTLTITGSTSNPSNTIKDVSIYAYGKAAGLIGWIQNTTLVVKNTTVTSTVKNNTSITANSIYESTVNYSAVGGIVGRSQDSKILLSSCKVTNMEIGSGKETAAGGLIGDSVVGSNILETFDCGVEDCQIQTYSAAGKNSFAGGLIGFLGGTWSGANVILSNSKVTNSVTSEGANYNGLLVGRMLDSSLSNATPISSAKIAGISIQNIESDQLALKDVGNLANENVAKKCYFAYANYDNNFLLTDPSISEPKGDLYDVTKPVYPYAVTSPVSELQVQKGEKTYNLFGDGASWAKTENTFSAKAEDIFKNATVDSGLFKYDRTGVDGFDFSKRMSTYCENQKTISSDGLSSSDFPVLQIAAGNTSVITDYLNILTNGGYSRAKSLSPGSVSAKTERYSWNGTNFVYEPGTASLRVNSDGSFSVAKDYDNEMNRFTLLTITFAERSQIDDLDYKYVLHIPIIVRRVLEVDFTATLSYGANLHSSAYDSLTHHVLDSFGNTISGYLTYTYNSAYGEFSEYGWQNYISEGGNVAQIMEKTLIFKQDNPFPFGTQLTLIDESTGKVYYKTINDDSKEIALSSFIDGEDDRKQFTSKSIGEILNIRVDDDNSTGKFVKVSADDNPTVKVGDSYFRLAKNDGSEEGEEKFTISVEEKQYSENYYLVITIPQSESSAVNGELITKLDGDIPHNINYKLRNQNAIDNHTNTSSTYLISKGYQQTLYETLDNTLSSTQVVNAADKTIHVSVESEVQFPLDQIYQDYDSLYHSFTANLQSFVSGKTEAAKFPSQTGGMVCFYIRDYENYYFNDTSNWASKTTEKTAIASYEWTSTGDSMELQLSTDGSIANLIDLQGVRDQIKKTRNNKFYIEAVLEAVLPPAGIDVIPEGSLNNGTPDNYARLTFVSHLSTQKASLSYSSTKSTKSDTRIKYYREKARENRLSYDADQIDQLGINLLDLRDEYIDQTGNSTRIETTATYDLTGVTDLKSVLQKSSGVRYSMKLYAKGDDTEYSTTNLLDGNAYISLGPSSRQYEYNNDTGTWTWIVSQTEYIENGELKTGYFYMNNTFTEKIPVWVRVDNFETDGHKYSNYKLELTVDVIDEQGTVLLETVGDYLVYTITKIKPEFVGN